MIELLSLPLQEWEEELGAHPSQYCRGKGIHLLSLPLQSWEGGFGLLSLSVLKREGLSFFPSLYDTGREGLGRSAS